MIKLSFLSNELLHFESSGIGSDVNERSRNSVSRVSCQSVDPFAIGLQINISRHNNFIIDIRLFEVLIIHNKGFTKSMKQKHPVLK